MSIKKQLIQLESTWRMREMIKTNKVKLNIHYDHIMRDYDIYRIGQELKGMDKEQRKIVQNSVETLADCLSCALAVLYRYGGYLYVIFNKDSVSIHEIQSHIDGQGIFVEKLDLNESSCIYPNVYPNDLCQLFFNMLPNMECFKEYNNVSGKLFYFNQFSFGENVVTAYNISIDVLEYGKPEYVVRLETKSFYRLSKVLEYNQKKEEEIRKLPKYYMDEENYIFHRALTQLNDNQCFVNKNPGSKKNKLIAKDLDIRNLQAFEDSKKGILYRFFKDVEAYFNDYIQLIPVDLEEGNTLNSYSKNISNDYKIKVFNDLGINVIDRVDNILSKKMVELMALKLKDRGIKNVGFHQDKQFNIVLIHDAEYYIDHNMKDQHTNDSCTQHFTYENCIGKNNQVNINDNMVDKILTELAVKRDIANQSLSTYQWHWDAPVEYVTKESVYNEKSNRYDSRYLVLNIFPGGTMKFHKVKDQMSEEYKNYDCIFQKDFKQKYHYNVKPEMLISTHKLKMMIIDTATIVMPDLDELHDRLEKYRKDRLISKDELTDLLKSFSEENVQYSDEIERTLEKLDKESYQYQEVVRRPNKSDDLPLLSLATSLGKDFVKYCRDNEEIVLNPCLKSDVVKKLQNINIIKDADALYYYVGKKKSVKYDLNTSCHIRQIIMLEGDFDEDFNQFIFDQLRVDFVRNKEYTVLPFTRKYINELNLRGVD